MFFQVVFRNSKPRKFSCTRFLSIYIRTKLVLEFDDDDYDDEKLTEPLFMQAYISCDKKRRY